MKSVFKYRIEAFGETPLELPAGAVILSVGSQDGALTLWALVNKEETATRKLVVTSVGTGSDIEADLGFHIGRVTIESIMRLELHVFVREVL